MLVIPAIDLRGGRCVRLQQGKFDQETVFGDDPVAIAGHWVGHGATYLHLVDLDGAREGQTVHAAIVNEIVTNGRVKCELGGGLRSDEAVDRAFALGVDRVVIGTQALRDWDWFTGLCRRCPGRVALGVDAIQGRAAVDGWETVTDRRVHDIASACADLPIAALIYTDISRDGMLSGPDMTTYASLKKAVDVPIIASGGVTTTGDVRRLAELGVAGCIIGRALYDGRIQLPDAIQAARMGAGATSTQT